MACLLFPYCAILVELYLRYLRLRFIITAVVVLVKHMGGLSAIQHGNFVKKH